MRDAPILERVDPLGGHRVRVTFRDGLVGEVDLSYLVGRGPVFEPLRDDAFFQQLRFDRDGNTIVWPNNADIAPETLYEKARMSASRLPATEA